VSDRPRHDADEPLPEWLLEELLELVEAFDHLRQPARHAAMKRNLSERAHAEFEARVDRHLRVQGEGEGSF